MTTPTRPPARRASSPRTPRRASCPRMPRPASSPRTPRPATSHRTPRLAARARNGGAPCSPPKTHSSPRGTFIPRPVRLAALDRWRRSRYKKRMFRPRALCLIDERRNPNARDSASYNFPIEDPPRKRQSNALKVNNHENLTLNGGSTQTSSKVKDPPGKNALKVKKQEDLTIELLDGQSTQTSNKIEDPPRKRQSNALKVNNRENLTLDHGSTQTSSKKNDFPVLPEEVINRICLCLMVDNLKDIASMKLCCKDWQLNTIRIFPADGPTWFRMMEDRMLFYRTKDQNVFTVKHKFTLPEILYCSSSGHLVTIIGKQHEILVMNLMTLTMTALPSLAAEFEDIQQVVSWQGEADHQFGTLAISSILGERSIGISVYCRTTGWVSRRCECQYHFLPSEVSSPVIINNSAYVIGRQCHIGVCNLDTLTWKLLPAKASWTMYTREECYLLSVEGDVIAIIVDELHDSQPIILKLNTECNCWDRIWLVEGFRLFSGSPTSLAIKDRSERSLVTVPSLCSKCSVTEANIRHCNGTMLFVVDNCIPMQSSLHFTQWIIDKDTSSSRFRFGERRMSFNIKEMLGAGTWLNVSHSHVDTCSSFIGPAERPL